MSGCRALYHMAFFTSACTFDCSTLVRVMQEESKVAQKKKASRSWGRGLL